MSAPYRENAFRPSGIVAELRQKTAQAKEQQRVEHMKWKAALVPSSLEELQMWAGHGLDRCTLPKEKRSTKGNARGWNKDIADYVADELGKIGLSVEVVEGNAESGYYDFWVKVSW